MYYIIVVNCVFDYIKVNIIIGTHYIDTRIPELNVFIFLTVPIQVIHYYYCLLHSHGRIHTYIIALKVGTVTIRNDVIYQDVCTICNKTHTQYAFTTTSGMRTRESSVSHPHHVKIRRYT